MIGHGLHAPVLKEADGVKTSTLLLLASPSGQAGLEPKVVGQMVESSEFRILVLDDHVEMAEAVAEFLEFEGHSMRVVHNGPDAVSAFQEEQFDLALFDIRMPGMNGVEAFNLIRSEHPDAIVVMLSGYADEELIQSVLKNGAHGILTKPFDPKDLLSIIDELSAAEINATMQCSNAVQP